MAMYLLVRELVKCNKMFNSQTLSNLIKPVAINSSCVNNRFRNQMTLQRTSKLTLKFGRILTGKTKLVRQFSFQAKINEIQFSESFSLRQHLRNSTKVRRLRINLWCQRHLKPSNVEAEKIFYPLVLLMRRSPTLNSTLCHLSLEWEYGWIPSH